MGWLLTRVLIDIAGAKPATATLATDKTLGIGPNEQTAPLAMVARKSAPLEVTVPTECTCSVQGSRLYFVEIYENQRLCQCKKCSFFLDVPSFHFHRFNGLMDPPWGSSPFPGHFLPSDRAGWTNEDGLIPVQVTCSNDLEYLKPPPTFDWMGEWEIDYDYTLCDEQVMMLKL